MFAGNLAAGNFGQNFTNRTLSDTRAGTRTDQSATDDAKSREPGSRRTGSVWGKNGEALCCDVPASSNFGSAPVETHPRNPRRSPTLSRFLRISSFVILVQGEEAFHASGFGET